jgi:hypothetical protein
MLILQVSKKLEHCDALLPEQHWPTLSQHAHAMASACYQSQPSEELQLQDWPRRPEGNE